MDRIAITDIIDHLTEAVDAARTSTTDRRWLNAIDAAWSHLLEAEVISYDRNTWEMMYVSESGQTYQANGTCQCKAFQNGQPCKHRAAARLVRRAIERKEVADRQLVRQRYEDARAALLECF